VLRIMKERDNRANLLSPPACELMCLEQRALGSY
jgi:hypothetical protein